MPDPIVMRAAHTQRVVEDWGSLTWFANAALGNSQELTVGRCVLKPGRENPFHSHPNCSEVLVVAQGRILHTGADGRDVEMGEGDAISIPPDFPHRAKNIGEHEAVLMLSFSSAFREVVKQ